jgi:hypothetical protein
MRRTITITEDEIIDAVYAEQERRGDGTAARTAGKLILERLYVLRTERMNARIARAAQVAATAELAGNSSI